MKRKLSALIAAFSAMAVLILDSGHAVQYAAEGVDAGNWDVSSPSTTAGVKVGDTVRIKRGGMKTGAAFTGSR